MHFEGDIYGETICKSPINKSSAKYMYSFSREPRFKFSKRNS